jgi:hypothetical protein
MAMARAKGISFFCEDGRHHPPTPRHPARVTSMRKTPPPIKTRFFSYTHICASPLCSYADLCFAYIIVTDNLFFAGVDSLLEFEFR